MSESYRIDRDERSSPRPDTEHQRLPRSDTALQHDSLDHVNTRPDDERLQTRGNGGARASIMQRAQQTHGNRAIQRVVQRSAATTSVPVQRDLLDGLQIGDWKILPPTWKGSTDDRYDTPENKRRAEMKDQDKRSNDPSPPKWWETPKYDPSAPPPWMPKINPPQQGPDLPPIPKLPDDRGDYPLPKPEDDEGEYA